MKRKPCSRILIFALALLAEGLAALFFIFQAMQSVEAKELALTEGRVNIHIQQESSPFEVEREDYEALLARLYAGEHFEYYEIYNQFLLPSEGADSGLFYMEDGSEQIPCIQIGTNVQESLVFRSQRDGTLAARILCSPVWAIFLCLWAAPTRSGSPWVTFSPATIFM